VLTLLLGMVWFSLADWENALWGFQLAWYMIVFCFMATLLCLSSRRLGFAALGGAAFFAIVASYASLQGLILWPVGLLALIWRLRGSPRKWRVIGPWVVVAVVVTALYFKGFNFQPDANGGGSVAFAVHHPIGMIKYFFAAVGGIFPTSGVDLRVHELLGAVLSVGAVYVLWRGWKEPSEGQGVPLPLTLIVFAALFDASIALGRLSFGVAQALASRYTMANLLLLVGIGLGLVHRTPKSRPLFSGQFTIKRSQIAVLGVLAVAVVGQVVMSSTLGITLSRANRASMITGARTVVNLSRIPPADREALISANVFPNLTALAPYLSDVEHDRLNVFAPGVYAEYRREGPPPTP
jgi:hypothetical protein